MQTVRTAGSKLVFLDVKDGDHTLQMVVQLKRVEASGGSLADFKSFTKVARKGDWISFTGHPHRTGRGQLSLLVTELPVLVSPSLHQIPELLEDPETRARQRHVDMLVNPATVQTLRVRHIVERAMHSFFDDKDFMKVNTPILQSGAGGAVARPFETEATELQGETLNLRIAPELWLKRLMVGGMDRVYELGPVFRNEGVDATHNPEFTICEFYAAKATLDDLMQWTEALFRHIQSEVSATQTQLSALDLPDLALSSPFQVLDFIPDLEKAMNRRLPDLSSTTAHPDIINLFAELNLELPSKPTLPRLLDALAASATRPDGIVVLDTSGPDGAETASELVSAASSPALPVEHVALEVDRDVDDVAECVLRERGDAHPDHAVADANPLVLGRVAQVVRVLQVAHGSPRRMASCGAVGAVSSLGRSAPGRGERTEAVRGCAMR